MVSLNWISNVGGSGKESKMAIVFGKTVKKRKTQKDLVNVALFDPTSYLVYFDWQKL